MGAHVGARPVRRPLRRGKVVQQWIGYLVLIALVSVALLVLTT